MSSDLDLHSLSKIDQCQVLFLVLRLYLKKRLGRPFLAWCRRYSLHWPVSIAIRHALISLIAIVIIPVKPGPGILLAIYGSSLCLSILLSRYPLIIPTRSTCGRKQKRDLISERLPPWLHQSSDRPTRPNPLRYHT